MKLMGINGSVRENSVDAKMATWIQDVLSKDSELQLDMVNLKEVDLPFLMKRSAQAPTTACTKTPKVLLGQSGSAKPMRTCPLRQSTTTTLLPCLKMLLTGWTLSGISNLAAL